MKIMAFASRNAKEILRDKTSLGFGIGFPVILLLLLSLIGANAPVDLFDVDKLTPGIAVFGMSFLSLFSGMIIAKDRTSSFMMRLFASPMESGDFIAGYTLPLIPMAVAQILICFVTALFLGLSASLNILLTVLVSIPAALLFIGIGLLCGSVFNDKQVGGACGALLTNLSAWLSGTWFDPAMVGGVFGKLAKSLPFLHAVDAGRYALAGEYGNIMPELWWVLAYAAAVDVIAVLVFRHKMKSE